MKYTLTIWIDFVDDTFEDAQVTAEDMEMAVRAALRQEPGVMKIERELVEDAR